MKIHQIEPIGSNRPTFQHKIESKIFYKNTKGNRIINKITLDNGKKIYIDTTTIGGKMLFKVKSLYDKSGKFIKSVYNSYKDGKIINRIMRDWE